MEKAGKSDSAQKLQEKMPHVLTLDARRKLTLTGATEIVSFDENSVILGTELGTLVVTGRDLSLKTLSAEGGKVEVEGKIDAMQYAEVREQGGWFRRLLG